MSDGQIFGTFRREHRPLSTYLSRLLGSAQARLSHPRGLDFGRTDEELRAELLAELRTVRPLEIGSVEAVEPQGLHLYGRNGYRHTMVVHLSGTTELVNYWPDRVPSISELAQDPPRRESGADPEPPHWSVNGSELRFSLEHFQGFDFLEEESIASRFHSEEQRVRRIVDAINEQLRSFVEDVTPRVLDAIAERRELHEEAQAIHQTLNLPPYTPLSIEVIESDNRSEEVPEDVALPPRMLVSDSDWSTFIWVVERWASTVARSPAAFDSLDEYSFRDLLLATLNTVYPVAVGEVMTAGRKSDIFVVADPSQPELWPMIAELKIWRSSREVINSVKQHVEQLTVRETRGLLLFFIRQRRLGRSRDLIHGAVTASDGFLRWIVPPSDTDEESRWPVAEVRSHQSDRQIVSMTVMDVFLDSSVAERNVR